MANLQPLHALNLDSLQQQNFIKFYNTLPEKPSTSVRIFDRNDYYSTHGEDAVTAAREIFNTTANIKQMGVEPNRLQYLVLSKGNFETFVRKLLLVRRYRVEIYTAEGSVKNNDWSIKYKGSPGNLTQMEEVLESGVGEATTETPSSLLAVNVRTDPVTKCRLVGVACVSIADYQFTVTEIADDDFLTELEAATVQLAPSECIIPQSDAAEYKTLKKIMERSNVTVTACKKSEYLTEGMIQDLNRLLKFSESQQQDANAFEETRKEVAMASLMAAIKYLELLSDQTNFGRYKLSLIQTDCFLHIDSSALCALNVFPAPGDTANAPSRHLFGLLDRCRTAHGKRLLAQWLRQPLRDINLINERLDIVEAFVNCPEVRQQLYEDHLKRIPDLQMLARRLTRKKANLQDCYRIYQAISRLSPLLKCLARTESSTVHSALAEPIAELSQDLEKYNEMVEATIDLEAVDRGDFLVKPSFDEQLEELAQVLARLQASADKLLSKAAKDLGLEAGKSIKLENNPQGGFHFRVTLKEEQALRGNKRYTIIDAVKGGVRFKIGELDSISDDYVQAKTTYGKEQNKVVAEIVNIAAGYSDCLYCLSHILSRLDVLMSFSLVAVSAPAPYCRPELVHSLDELVLEEARHPCVEVQDGVSFIANDVRFKRGESLLHIVTGANMGGKSTWMRSAGACVLLAHAGCYVPCSRAIVPRLRSLCSRVGATDREVAGHSTFMVEMVETAAILRIATPDSLVLIDELGRGTSTYEGCGIAWAIAEQLATQTQCFCLFATHYHELTRLPTVAPGRAVNSHAQASVVDDQLLLLHRIMPGPALKSLGLHVARLADLPESIVKFAEAKQAQLETNLFEMDSAAQSSEASDGHRLVEKFLKDCKALDVENLSDDELNDAVDKLKSKLDGCGNRYVEMLMAV